MEPFRSLQRFLRYYFKAHTWYRVHSPFVYDFAEQVLEDERWYYPFSAIEGWRSQLLKNNSKMEVSDFGAGSRLHASKLRTISSLAKHSACRPVVGQWLFKIIMRSQPTTMLELGSSLGISTAYQSAAAPHARFITLEGDHASANVAKETLKQLGLSKVDLRIGRFEELLLPALKDLQKLDYLFVDGNHRREPTLDYFQKCLAYAHPDSIFIFDDIHWSRDMEQAWEQIKSHPRVMLSVDLFFLGVVFFRKEKLDKEHFTLIPWRWKPWAVGWGDLF